MSMGGRAKQRGKPLDKDCYLARKTKYEYGANDERLFCLGLCVNYNDEQWQLKDKCIECGALRDNAEPPKE